MKIIFEDDIKPIEILYSKWFDDLMKYYEDDAEFTLKQIISVMHSKYFKNDN